MVSHCDKTQLKPFNFYIILKSFPILKPYILNINILQNLLLEKVFQNRNF